MTSTEAIVIIIGILGIWASLWYRLGLLAAEVRGHNKRLDELSKQLTNFATRGVIRHEPDE